MNLLEKSRFNKYFLLEEEIFKNNKFADMFQSRILVRTTFLILLTVVVQWYNSERHQNHEKANKGTGFEFGKNR